MNEHKFSTRSTATTPTHSLFVIHFFVINKMFLKYFFLIIEIHRMSANDRHKTEYCEICKVKIRIRLR